MNYYKLRIAYDGTAYAGWQQQPHGLSVADALKKACTEVFSVDCSIVAASRTDAGVHAYDQVARIMMSRAIDADRMLHALNNALPSDIVIRSLEPCTEAFHPQYNVAWKEYWYHIFLSRPLPFVSRFGWRLPEYITEFDTELFTKTLQLFVGTHNFTSFARVDPGHDPVRTVDAIYVSPLACYNAIRVVVRGEGFLRYQIRRMLGAALMVARSGAVVSYEEIQQLLITPQHTSPAFLKIPGQGLCLRRIVYKKEQE
jgi:tRNA pseudouridine38-40 synthase